MFGSKNLVLKVLFLSVLCSLQFDNSDTTLCRHSVGEEEEGLLGEGFAYLLKKCFKQRKERFHGIFHIIETIIYSRMIIKMYISASKEMLHKVVCLNSLFPPSNALRPPSSPLPTTVCSSD